MKTSKIVILGIVLTFVLSLAAVAFANSEVIFSDDFSSNTLSSYQRNSNKITYDEARERLLFYIPDEQKGWIRKVLPENSDSVRADLGINFVRTAPHEDDWGGAVWAVLRSEACPSQFSYQNDFTKNYGCDGIAVKIEKKSGQKYMSKISVYKYFNKKTLIKDVGLNTNLSLEEDHLMRIEVNDSDVRVYLDGDLIYGRSDPTLTSINYVDFAFWSQQFYSELDSILIEELDEELDNSIDVDLISPSDESVLDSEDVDFDFEVNGPAKICFVNVSGEIIGNQTAIVQGSNTVHAQLDNGMYEAYVYCLNFEDERFESNHIDFEVNATQECDCDSDCGEDGFIGGRYCRNGDVYQDYITYTCSSHTCSSSVEERKVESCLYGCYGGVCRNESNAPIVNLLFPTNGSIFNYRDIGFVFNVSDESEIERCSLNISGQFVENSSSIVQGNNTIDVSLLDGEYSAFVFCIDEFGNRGESNRVSFRVNATQECDCDSDCGEDGFIGGRYCRNGDVYQDYITYTCSSHTCSSSVEERKVRDCEHGCEDGSCKSEDEDEDDDRCYTSSRDFEDVVPQAQNLGLGLGNMTFNLSGARTLKQEEDSSGFWLLNLMFILLIILVIVLIVAALRK